MYAIDIVCSNGHVFESWFKSRSSFEEQREVGLVSCPHCGDTCIEQKLTPVRIGKHKRNSETAPIQNTGGSQFAEILAHIEKTFEDVGTRFPEEAMKIYLGESEQRNIRGIATPEEARELEEEGVPLFKIPEVQ